MRTLLQILQSTTFGLILLSPVTSATAHDVAGFGSESVRGVGPREGRNRSALGSCGLIETRLDTNDRRGITPLIYAHVNPYGSFQLDRNSRLPIDPPRLGPQSVGTQLLLRYDQQTG